MNRGIDYIDETTAYKAFVGRLQLTILLACGLAAVGILVAQNASPGRMIGVLAFVLIILCSRWAMRYGPDVATKFLAVAMWTVNSVYVFSFAGVHSANVIIYPFLVALCGWILGRRWLIALASSTIAFLLAVGCAEYLGYFQPTPRAGPMLVTLATIGVMIAVAFLTHAAFAGFAASRDRLVAMSAVLSEQNLQLTEKNVSLLAREAEILELNETLEARVVLRTGELDKAIRELKQTQVGLARAERMAALGALVAGVSHELNTPLGNSLTAASTLSDLSRTLQSDVEGAGLKKSQLLSYAHQVDEGAKLVLRNLERAVQLIQSFKQVSVDQTCETQRRFDLAHMISDVVSTLQPSLGKQAHHIDIHVKAGLVLDSYPGPLGQVMINLIQNAYLHGFDNKPFGGIVRVDALPTGSGNTTGVQISVIDNGRGISSHHLPRVFEPFFTTKMGQGGTGLGLNIAYNIVTQLLGGRIEVHSQEGLGTRFEIFLPANVESVAE